MPAFLNAREEGRWCCSESLVIIGTMLELIPESVKNSANSASLRGKKGVRCEGGKQVQMQARCLRSGMQEKWEGGVAVSTY
jgi:hypothetical protein